MLFFDLHFLLLWTSKNVLPEPSPTHPHKLSEQALEQPHHLDLRLRVGGLIEIVEEQDVRPIRTVKHGEDRESACPPETL